MIGVLFFTGFWVVLFSLLNRAVWVLRLWAYVTRREVVWLIDSDMVGGDITPSIATKHPTGKVQAKRYWPFDIRVVTLLPEGKIDNDAYVVAWKPYNIKQEPTNATS